MFTGTDGNKGNISNRWLNKQTVVYSHSGIILCVNIKKDELLVYTIKCLDIKIIMLSELK